MTAFATCDGDGYTWEIRSLNHRGLDIRVKLPEDVAVLEPEILEMVRNSTVRGKIDIAFRRQSRTQLTIDSEHPVQKNLNDSLSRLIESLPDNVVPTIDLLTWLRNFETLADSISVVEYDLDLVRQSFNHALNSFLEERRREGTALQSDILDKAQKCAECVQKIGKHTPQQVLLAKENLERRIEQLGVSVDPTRIAQEVAVIAQRFDFSEELERTKTHLNEIQTCLTDSQSEGRRVQFLIQELGREANTLASKAQTSKCAMLAVDLKVFVDQMREQVNNVE